MRNFSFVISKNLAGMAYPGIMGNLQEDLEFLQSKNITAIVTLTEESLNREEIEKNNFSYIHIPIRDFQPPTIDQVKIFVDFTEKMIQENKAVAVHCHAGIGRTGTMLACYLVKTGMKANDAISEIRYLRPGSIETRAQEDVIFEYSATL